MKILLLMVFFSYASEPQKKDTKNNNEIQITKKNKEILTENEFDETIIEECVDSNLKKIDKLIKQFLKWPCDKSNIKSINIADNVIQVVLKKKSTIILQQFEILKINANSVILIFKGQNFQVEIKNIKINKNIKIKYYNESSIIGEALDFFEITSNSNESALITYFEPLPKEIKVKLKTEINF